MEGGKKTIWKGSKGETRVNKKICRDLNVHIVFVLQLISRVVRLLVLLSRSLLVRIKKSQLWLHAPFLPFKPYSLLLTTRAALQSSMRTILHIDSEALVKRAWQAYLGVNWSIHWLLWNKKSQMGEEGLADFLPQTFCALGLKIFSLAGWILNCSVSAHSLKEDCWWI